jgi:hypothetical protein
MSSVTRGYVVGLMIGHLQHYLTELQRAQGGLELYLTPALPTAPKGKTNHIQWVRGPIQVMSDYVVRLQQIAVTEAGLDDAEITRGIAEAHATHAEISRVWLDHLGEEGRQVVWNEITDPPRIPRTPVRLPES